MVNSHFVFFVSLLLLYIFGSFCCFLFFSKPDVSRLSRLIGSQQTGEQEQVTFLT